MGITRIWIFIYNTEIISLFVAVHFKYRNDAIKRTVAYIEQNMRYTNDISTSVTDSREAFSLFLKFFFFFILTRTFALSDQFTFFRFAFSLARSFTAFQDDAVK